MKIEKSRVQKKIRFVSINISNFIEFIMFVVFISQRITFDV